MGKAGEDGGGVLERITESAAVDISKRSEGVSRSRPCMVVSVNEAFRKTEKDEDLH